MVRVVLEPVVGVLGIAVEVVEGVIIVRGSVVGVLGIVVEVVEGVIIVLGLIVGVGIAAEVVEGVVERVAMIVLGLADGLVRVERNVDVIGGFGVARAVPAVMVGNDAARVRNLYSSCDIPHTSQYSQLSSPV